MKLTNQKRRLTFMSLFLATALVAGIHSNKTNAQDDMLDAADDALNSEALQMDDINLEGKISPSERLRQRREKLEERNKYMVEKKIEDIRVKQEMALTNKLQDAFGKSLNNLDQDKVQVVQAAPVAPQPVVETKIIEVKEAPAKELKKSKVIPYFGMQSIKGDKIDFESNFNVGASFETMVMTQLSVGLGVGYTTLDITDTANDFIMSGTQIGPTYQNSFGVAGRKMSSNKLSVEANSKFFLTTESRIKPFVGTALSYNRSTIKYEDAGNSYNYNNVNYGNEGYSSTSVGAAVKLGTEVDFSETVGLNVDLSYAKNISSGISSAANTTNINPDQARLKNITESMEKADTTSIQAGLIVRF